MRGMSDRWSAGMHQNGRGRRGGPRGGQTGGWRRLPKRLGAVSVGYKCHSRWHLPSGRQWLGIGWAPWRVRGWGVKQGGGGGRGGLGPKSLCTKNGRTTMVTLVRGRGGLSQKKKKGTGWG